MVEGGNWSLADDIYRATMYVGIMVSIRYNPADGKGSDLIRLPGIGRIAISSPPFSPFQRRGRARCGPRTETTSVAAGAQGVAQRRASTRSGAGGAAADSASQHGRTGEPVGQRRICPPS